MPLVLLTTPLLWVNGVVWIISLGVALVATLLIVMRLMIRQEADDIHKNGPFIEIGGGEIRFPPGLVARHGLPPRVSLSDLGVQSWYARSIYSNGHRHYPLAGYLEFVGGGIDLVLEPDSEYPPVTDLVKIDWNASVARLRKRKVVRVDGGKLVTTALAFRMVLEKRDAAVMAAAEKDAAEKAHAAQGARRIAQAMAAMQSAAARAANPTPPVAEVPTVDNIRSLLFYGGLKQVPPDLLDYVRNWRGRVGDTLLHDTSSNRAVAVLLAAGLDPAARDSYGRTPLMVYGRTANANCYLIDAGTPIEAVCKRGHNAVWHQATPPGGAGYCDPDYNGVEMLFAAGLPPPTLAEAENWKDAASHAVTAAAEQNACIGFAKWLDRIAQDPPTKEPSK
ncbi:MAG: hypothetical protein WAT09_13590 [Paracoccaceae bacterium]